MAAASPRGGLHREGTSVPEPGFDLKRCLHLGGLGVDRMLPALVLRLLEDSLPWNCRGALMVPKCCWVGNTGPLTPPAAGGDLWEDEPD